MPAVLVLAILKVGALVFDLMTQVHFSSALKPPVAFPTIVLFYSVPSSGTLTAPQISFFCLHWAYKSSFLLSFVKPLSRSFVLSKSFLELFVVALIVA